MTATFTPENSAEIADLIRAAAASGTPVYPLGGQTALDYGLPARQAGQGLSLAGLSRLIDYPARDMTVTVEAGMTLGHLREVLARENQQLPFDVPQAAKATLGGIVATAWNGPRRYGYGAVRDYVIGIGAVDGRGTPFKGGGRVVKNVAGYDFCKLLTGSLGTLGVITQLTFRLRPLVERAAWVGCEVRDLDEAEKLLAALVVSETAPSSVELLVGPEWRLDSRLAAVSRDGAISGESSSVPTSSTAWLLVGLEGTAVEVSWMIERLQSEWRELGVTRVERWLDEQATGWTHTLAEFTQRGPCPLVVQAVVRPSHVTRMVAAMRELDSNVSAQCHAGNGVVLARFSQFPAAGISRTIVGRLQAVAAEGEGAVVIVSNPSGQEATVRSVWNVGGISHELMTSVKRQFDPANILNPGRFIFP